MPTSADFLDAYEHIGQRSNVPVEVYRYYRSRGDFRGFQRYLIHNGYYHICGYFAGNAIYENAYGDDLLCPGGCPSDDYACGRYFS